MVSKNREVTETTTSEVIEVQQKMEVSQKRVSAQKRGNKRRKMDLRDTRQFGGYRYRGFACIHR